MDIWIEPSNENLPKLLAALKDFGIEESSLHLVSQIDLTTVQIFHVGSTPQRIDFLTHLSGLKFNEAVSQVNYLTLENKQVPVIKYDHLIRTKTATGRAKDKADIEELERINKYRKN